MKFIEYANRDDLMAEVAKTLAADLRAALDARDRVTLGVPGGTTPGPVFDALSEVDLDWKRVHVLLTDERWVPKNDAQSNAALICQRLLTGQAAAAKFTPYFNSDTSIEDAAIALSHELDALQPIDVLMLGMGADMHTASLFPGAGGLDEALSEAAPMFAAIAVPDQQVRRFTLSAPALRRARRTHLLITGQDKRAALDRAASLPPEQAPVSVILETATVHWSDT